MEENTNYESRLDLTHIKDAIERLKDEIAKVIVGQERMVDLLIASLLANGHVLIEGYPGLAKTLTARLLAKSISTNFSRLQFTPDLMPSDVLGTSVFNFQTSTFEFKKGPIFSNMILIDEINRAPAKTQSALFEVMQERQVTLDGTTYDMDRPFMIIATQNPIDLEGTYKLPEAQMDRFLFKIHVDYPNLEDEVSIIENHHKQHDISDLDVITKVLTEEEVSDYQSLLHQVHVEPKLIRYIAELVNRTRSYKDIMIGASPRASLALLNGAKAIAIIQGRDFVTPDDILFVSNSVLAHRITITPEKEMEGSSEKEVIIQLVKSLEIPR